MACARRAGTSSPRNRIPMACCRPTARVRLWVTPRSGRIPSWGTKTRRKRDDSAMMTMSHARARPTPPPAAIPFTYATVGTFVFARSFIIGFHRYSNAWAMAIPRESWGSVPKGPTVKSAPAQNARPLPVINMHRTSSLSLASPRAARTSRIISTFRALYFFGLFKRRTNTPSSTFVSTVSIRPISLIKLCTALCENALRPNGRSY
mmetsp:Transcript_12762/g.36074  ORF Transcript_12762/g.36074 Transcript_12762/m.36074 type:complete len:206 (+) Transcript_12762:62-679(+)